MAKLYLNLWSFDYGNTFSPVAKITLAHPFLPMVTILHWPLHQLDIKNVLFNGEQEETIYIEQPPKFGAQGGS